MRAITMFSFFKRKKAQETETDKSQTDETGAESLSTSTEEEVVTEPTSDVTTDSDVSPGEQSEPAAQPDEVPEIQEIEKPVTEASEQPAQESLTAEPLTAAEEAATTVETPATSSEPEPLEQPKEKPSKPGFFARIRKGLSKTRSGLTDGLANLLLGKKAIDDDLLEELETQLILADVGVEATSEIMGRLTERVSRKELSDSDALYNALIEELKDTLSGVQAPLDINTGARPYVILMVGINGVGKTTTIGKLARQFQNDGKSVMLAAGDTFRAAAVEQLQVWGERNNVPVVAQHTGADSASVLFDALQAAQARDVDVLIADTAGRLHTKDNLMQELEKVVRVMKKLDPEAPHEVMLVLDAGTGQNAINQARQFQQAVGVTGLTLTKLDGTAKGGVIFALSKQLGLPVRYIGVGEGIEDLRPFQADEFIKALFQRDNKD